MNEFREYFILCQTCNWLEDFKRARLTAEVKASNHALRLKHMTYVYSKDLVLHQKVDHTGEVDSLTLF